MMTTIRKTWKTKGKDNSNHNKSSHHPKNSSNSSNKVISIVAKNTQVAWGWMDPIFLDGISITLPHAHVTWATLGETASNVHLLAPSSKNSNKTNAMDQPFWQLKKINLSREIMFTHIHFASSQWNCGCPPCCCQPPLCQPWYQSWWMNDPVSKSSKELVNIYMSTMETNMLHTYNVFTVKKTCTNVAMAEHIADTNGTLMLSTPLIKVEVVTLMPTWSHEAERVQFQFCAGGHSVVAIQGTVWTMVWSHVSIIHVTVIAIGRQWPQQQLHYQQCILAPHQMPIDTFICIDWYWWIGCKQEDMQLVQVSYQVL